MARQEQQHATKAAHSFKSRHLMVAFLLLAACLSGGCQTVKPGNSVLDRLQESATPAPRDSPSPPMSSVVRKPPWCSGWSSI